MRQDDTIHDERQDDAVAETLPPGSTAQAHACVAALQQTDDERSSAPGCVQGCHVMVQVSRNETPRGSWQAELALGPQDRIIVDGHSAAHAVQQLVAALPAALAARQQHGTEHTTPPSTTLYPSAVEVLVSVHLLDDLDATIADLVCRGYRSAASSDGWQHTPEGVPICP